MIVPFLDLWRQISLENSVTRQRTMTKIPLGLLGIFTSGWPVLDLSCAVFGKLILQLYSQLTQLCSDVCYVPEHKISITTFQISIAMKKLVKEDFIIDTALKGHRLI